MIDFDPRGYFHALNSSIAPLDFICHLQIFSLLLSFLLLSFLLFSQLDKFCIFFRKVRFPLDSVGLRFISPSFNSLLLLMSELFISNNIVSTLTFKRVLDVNNDRQLHTNRTYSHTYYTILSPIQYED